MSEVFDISQHIRVETLGYRDGVMTYDGLVVNDILYNPNDYNVVAIPPTETALTHFQNAGMYAYSTQNWSVPAVRVAFKRQSGDVNSSGAFLADNYKVYAIGPRDTNNFTSEDNPRVDGVLLEQTTAQAINSTLGLITVSDLSKTPKWYKFGMYYGSGNTAFATHVTQAETRVYYNWNISATGPIGATVGPSYPDWQINLYGGTTQTRYTKLNYDNNFVFSVRAVDHTNFNQNVQVPINYKVYIDDVFVREETLYSYYDYMEFQGSEEAFTPTLNQSSTIKLYRSSQTPGVDQPVTTLTATCASRTGREWPAPYEPLIVSPMSDTIMRLRWDGTSENFYLNVFGSDETARHFTINRMSAGSDFSTGETPDIEVTVTGLNLTDNSYRFSLYRIDPSTQAKIEVDSVTYGANPPAQPPLENYDATAYGWWPIQGSTTRCDITQGYNIDKGMLYKPEVGTCNIDLKGHEADPRINTAIQLDNKVRVILDAAASPDDEDDYLFAGFIEDISTTYDTFGNAITQLGCVDAMSRVLNVIVPVYDIGTAESFSVRMNRLFEDYILPKTWGVSVDDTFWPAVDQYDRSVFPPELRDNVAVSELINELTEGEAAVMVQNRGGVIFFYNRSVAALLYEAYADDLIASDHHIGFSTEHHDSSLDHFCISDFTIQNSINDITNYVTATLTYDDATELTASDALSIQRYGERAYAVSLNLHAPAGNITQYLQSWIDEVPYFETQSELNSVTTNVVNRAGKVTRAYQKDATLQPIRVYIDKYPVNVNGVWFAKQVKHSITPESWVMELDLTSD